MWRTVGMLATTAIAATVIAGCVADRYDDRRYGGRERGYYEDDDDHYRGRHRRHDEDRGAYQLPTLVCASKDGRPNRCHTDVPIQRADVDKRYSGSPCEYGRSWGYDRNEVWVDRGCRARFVLTPAGRSR